MDMTTLDTLLKCFRCSRWYKFYSMMVGDQSMCPKCRRQIEGEWKKQGAQ